MGAGAPGHRGAGDQGEEGDLRGVDGGHDGGDGSGDQDRAPAQPAEGAGAGDLALGGLHRPEGGLGHVAQGLFQAPGVLAGEGQLAALGDGEAAVACFLLDSDDLLRLLDQRAAQFVAAFGEGLQLAGDDAAAQFLAGLVGGAAPVGEQFGDALRAVAGAPGLGAGPAGEGVRLLLLLGPVRPGGAAGPGVLAGRGGGLLRHAGAGGGCRAGVGLGVGAHGAGLHGQGSGHAGRRVRVARGGGSGLGWPSRNRRRSRGAGAGGSGATVTGRKVSRWSGRRSSWTAGRRCTPRGRRGRWTGPRWRR